MEIKGIRDHLDSIRKLEFPVGSHTVWLILTLEIEDSVSVHFSIPGANPGPRIGYVASRSLPYALAYVANGMVVGEGKLTVYRDGDIVVALGEKGWKGF